MVLSPLEKTIFKAETLIYMEPSFRDILSSFLEEKSSNPPDFPSKTALFTDSGFDFYWQSPLELRTRKSTYARPAMPFQAQPEMKIEPLIPLEKLNASDLALAQTLIRLGASELAEGLSPRVLRQAHRRLAKRLHPDMQPQGASLLERERSRLGFIELQKAYETLSETLKAYTASSACDSEFASAPGRPHRDAA